jgi:hypothetical protein
MKDAWEYIGLSFDSTMFVLSGVDVWAHDWIATGERVGVNDPQYGQDFDFEIWVIDTGKKKIEFVAGEFSNCVWGFYTRKSRNEESGT